MRRSPDGKLLYVAVSGSPRALSLVLGLLTILVCKKDLRSPTAKGASTQDLSGARLDLSKLQADDGQWVMATKNYANTRYSSLDQINTSMVGKLQVRGRSPPTYCAGTSTVAAAHAGHHHEPQPGTASLWHWTWDPLATPVLAISSSLYARGLWTLWRRAGVGQGIRWWEASSDAVGMLSLVVALLSPLKAFSDALFSAHMSQHEALLVMGKPLLVMGKPLVVVLWALPGRAREAVGGWTRREAVSATWRTLTGPFVVLVAHAIALWIWHVPLLFEAALKSDGLHAIKHLCFFVTAALFWWALVHGRRARRVWRRGAVRVRHHDPQWRARGAAHRGTLAVVPAVCVAQRGGGGERVRGSAAGGVDHVGAGGAGVRGRRAGAVRGVAGRVRAEGVARPHRGAGDAGAEEGRIVRRMRFLATAAVLLAWGCQSRDVERNRRAAEEATGGDIERGEAAIRKYGCGSCDVIPGIPGAVANVGPPLEAIALRTYLAGHQTNNAANLRRWIQHPRQVEQGTAMPEMGVTDTDAKDIAAYLYTLR